MSLPLLTPSPFHRLHSIISMHLMIMVQLFYVIQFGLSGNWDELLPSANAKNEPLFLLVFSSSSSPSCFSHVQLSLITLAHNFAFQIGNLDGAFYGVRYVINLIKHCTQIAWCVPFECYLIKITANRWCYHVNRYRGEIYLGLLLWCTQCMN